MNWNEMEKRLRCEDRGPVDPFTDGALRWVVCCGRCNHTAHIVIVHATGERKYACPRCLVFLDGSITPHPNPNKYEPSVNLNTDSDFKKRKSWADFQRERAMRNTHPAVKNRIRRYL